MEGRAIGTRAALAEVLARSLKSARRSRVSLEAHLPMVSPVAFSEHVNPVAPRLFSFSAISFIINSKCICASSTGQPQARHRGDMHLPLTSAYIHFCPNGPLFCTQLQRALCRPQARCAWKYRTKGTESGARSSGRGAEIEPLRLRRLSVQSQQRICLPWPDGSSSSASSARARLLSEGRRHRA